MVEVTEEIVRCGAAAIAEAVIGGGWSDQDIAQAAAEAVAPLIEAAARDAALEEAARRVDSLEGYGVDYPYDGGAGTLGWDRACDKAAIEIRALKGGGGG